jgi:hypothetical protein
MWHQARGKRGCQGVSCIPDPVIRVVAPQSPATRRGRQTRSRYVPVLGRLHDRRCVFYVARLIKSVNSLKGAYWTVGGSRLGGQ